MKYGLTQKQLQEIQAILAEQPKVASVWLFGSRALDTYKEASDIDLAIKGSLGSKTLVQLKDAFEDSNLPFFVDLVDYERITEPALKKHIDAYGICIYGEGAGMSEWRGCKLGDIATLHYGKALRADRRTVGGAPVYSSAGLTGSHDEPLVNSKGLIVGRKGTVGKVYLSPRPFWCIDTAYYILPDDSKYDFKYLYFILQTLGLEELNEDSAVPGLNRDTAYQQQLLLPPLPEQKAIAAVLSSLDDKIDLLHRQNQTLEAMAATLFRQWFVEEAQEDWVEAVITDLFEVRDGTHDSPKQTSIGKPLITSKHILDGRLDVGNAYLISDDDFNQVNQRSKVDTGDILFSMIGTIGLLYLEQSRSVDYAIKNIGLFKTSQNPDWALYTYLWLRSSNGRQFIGEHKSGSTQEYISLGSLRSIVFQKPPIDVLQSFNKLASGYFSKMILNRSQIHTLEKLRDTLLPKLMSGEIRVAV